MDVRASLQGYRISAQKARLVVNQVRGKGVEDALNLLSVSPKSFARPLAKLLRSAVANAEQRNDTQSAGIDIDNLVVSTITVDEGRRGSPCPYRAELPLKCLDGFGHLGIGDC